MIRNFTLALLTTFPLLAADNGVYTHPGIVVSQGSGWVGSDHLLNLPKELPLIVEILKPEGASLPFDEASVKAHLEESFKKKEFNTDSLASERNPGIPFFQLLLVAYPIDKGFVAIIEGRLMESVDPLRVALEKETLFQAITWEKKTLVVAPTDEFKTVVFKNIDDITAVFFERFEYFEKLKSKMEGKKGTERLVPTNR